MKQNTVNTSPAESPAVPAPAFLPMLSATVAGYTVTPLPRPASLVALYAIDGQAVADFAVTWKGKDSGEMKKTEVNLYFRTDAAPIPYGFSRNGLDNGGALQWSTAGGVTELQDFDGDFSLPKSVCAVLRAHGLTVPDDCLASPL